MPTTAAASSHSRSATASGSARMEAAAGVAAISLPPWAASATSTGSSSPERGLASSWRPRLRASPSTSFRRAAADGGASAPPQASSSPSRAVIGLRYLGAGRRPQGDRSRARAGRLLPRFDAAGGGVAGRLRLCPQSRRRLGGVRVRGPGGSGRLDGRVRAPRTRATPPCAISRSSSRISRDVPASSRGSPNPPMIRGCLGSAGPVHGRSAGHLQGDPFGARPIGQGRSAKRWRAKRGAARRRGDRWIRG